MTDITIPPLIFPRRTGTGGLEICIQKPDEPLQAVSVSPEEAALINEYCAAFLGDAWRGRFVNVKV